MPPFAGQSSSSFTVDADGGRHLRRSVTPLLALPQVPDRARCCYPLPLSLRSAAYTSPRPLAPVGPLLTPASA
ncbi:hypothetical protein EVAR_92056_1 [Eumeta japonica]|uniref:Uncharacterized protein n=1 Tax=Eumeta variegata TaxID=151549 RepID=A0A4C1SYV4_EUMVA|nr:hypothetical protein EVAR_92056_1 [Eumeta japonica]